VTHIFTSSWFTKLPPSFLRIGISRATPRGMQAGFRIMRELAPGPWFNSVSPHEYDVRFSDQLARLDARAILAKIEGMAGDLPDAALLCYEDPRKPDDWCHRGQVSRWFKDQLGLAVYEYGHEREGCGHAHPKLHYSVRKAAPTPLDREIVAPFIGRTAIDPQGRTWKVAGINPDLPSQVRIIDEANGDARSLSIEIVQLRFGDQPRLDV
jgi:hypothetical protein